MAESPSIGAYRFQVGQLECMVFQDIGMPRPLNQMLPDAPQEEALALARLYNINPEALDFSINILLVKTESHLVLVDTGIGTSNLPEKIRNAGINPADIDTIIITHGHRDHVGGILDTEGNFVYPNAHYFIWQLEYDYWTSPEQVATADKNPVIGIFQALQNHPDKLTVMGHDGDEADIVAGIRAIFAPGHTIGHIAVSVESGTEKLLHMVDAVHVPIQISRPDWSPTFDSNPAQSVPSRSKLFAQAIESQSLVMAYHFPFPSVGRITNDNLPWHPIA